jgi:hypothetical protein
MCSLVTVLFAERQAKQLIFFSALVADRKMLLDSSESFGNGLADQVKFSELSDLHQAHIAVDFNGLRGTHDIEHFLEFRTG